MFTPSVGQDLAFIKNKLTTNGNRQLNAPVGIDRFEQSWTYV